MYVCHCRGVTDGRIRAAIEGGALHTSEIARRCGAGTGCGGCHPALQRLLAEYGLSEAAEQAMMEAGLSKLIAKIGEAHYLAQQLHG